MVVDTMVDPQALHMDGARIFSVDSTGKLVIHDFLDYNDKEKPTYSWSYAIRHRLEARSILPAHPPQTKIPRYPSQRIYPSFLRDFMNQKGDPKHSMSASAVCGHVMVFLQRESKIFIRTWRIPCADQKWHRTRALERREGGKERTAIA